MKLCRNCDGFIPPEITNCPNCGVKPNKLGRDVQSVQKIVSGIASLSVGMTLMACYGLPPSQYEGKGVLIALLITENTQGVQAVITAPSDQGTLTIELGKKSLC